jgi:6-phosphogluconolactonase
MPTRILQTPKAAIRVYHDPAELALKAARSFARLADQYVIGCGRFSVALSGGTTPRAMFEHLAAEPLRETIPWSSIFFFWGDERAVGPDHVDSNFRMANDTLLSRVPVPAENIFRMHGEDPNLSQAADDYSDTLRRVLGSQSGLPRLDLILLGMGADGHTASLFPGSPALEATGSIVVSNFVEKFGTSRLTLTAPAINAARNIRFVVGGEDKAPALKAVLEGPPDPRLYPSQLIHPSDGSLLWMTDEGAASQLGK